MRNKYTVVATLVFSTIIMLSVNLPQIVIIANQESVLTTYGEGVYNNKEEINTPPNYAEQQIVLPHIATTIPDEIFEETVNSYEPQLDTVGHYTNDDITGSVDENQTISLPGGGDYTLNGNVSNLEALYLQNMGAETEQSFYADDVQHIGIELERLYDNVSYEGDYAWKFYSDNTVPVMRAIYQKQIPLYEGESTISYKYLLESNSSIKTTVNSSLTFDFTFDTCRIIVSHWMYSDPPDALLGANSTTPPIIYRLSQNSSWDDQWNSFSLNISQLFDIDDPYRPTTFEGIGFFTYSSTPSESSFLIDNFQIKSEIAPSDVSLQINNIEVSNATILNEGTFETDVSISDANPNLSLEWNHNSNYEINGNYEVVASGDIIVPFEKSTVISEEGMILHNLSYYGLSSDFNYVNITYPNTWEVYDIDNSTQIDVMQDIVDNEKVLTISSEYELDVTCQFIVPNSINEIICTSSDIFETLTANIEFNEQTTESSFYIFWYGEGGGSAYVKLNDSAFSYTFPSTIAQGEYEIKIIHLEEDKIGYVTCNINLERLPAELSVLEQIDIPQYGLKTIDVSYTDLSEEKIDVAFIHSTIDNETLPIVETEESYQIPLSTYFLRPGNYVLEINANSTNHASVQKFVNVHVYESSINANLKYMLINENSNYLLELELTSDTIPVGYAPLTLEIDTGIVLTGITDIDGSYSQYVNLPVDASSIEVVCKIFKGSIIIHSQEFEIVFDIIEVQAQRIQEEIIIEENISLEYTINYPIANEKWFLEIQDEIIPILDAYIDTDTYRIPVIWDDDAIYWEVEANENSTDHVLTIITTGPTYSASVEKDDKSVKIHFTITASKNFQNVSLLYYMDEDIDTSKYSWKMTTSDNIDITDSYLLLINDLYAYISEIDLLAGSYLIFDIVGTINNFTGMTGILIPLISSSTAVVGASTVGLKVYKKRKSMIIEI